jgi:sentrin-specific protease 1
VDEHRKGGIGRMDISGCQTDIEARQRIDEYWRPRELPLLGQKPTAFEPTKVRESPSKERDSSESLHRRHSDSSESPTTPGAFSSYQKRVSSWAPKTPKANSPRTPESLPHGKAVTSGTEIQESLADRLTGLLITPEDQKEDRFLQPSASKNVEREGIRIRRAREEREAAIRAAKALRLSRRKPLKALVAPLSSKWEDMVNAAQYTRSHHHVITTSIGGTELRLKDFNTLLGRHAWLNDEIINSYIEWVVDAANKAAVVETQARDEKASGVPRFIAHNSFFYENLNKKGPSSTERLMKRKKAPGKSLLEVDSVFVPICRGSHWTIGVVRPVAKTIEYFDSMGGNGRHFIDLMRSWLKFQLGDSYVEEEWKEPRTACAIQNNGYDCGVFVCTNAFCVALGLDTSCYQERDMVQQRRNIAAVLINRGFSGDFQWNMGGL